MQKISSVNVKNLMDLALLQIYPYPNQQLYHCELQQTFSFSIFWISRQIFLKILITNTLVNLVFFNAFISLILRQKIYGNCGTDIASFLHFWFIFCCRALIWNPVHYLSFFYFKFKMESGQLNRMQSIIIALLANINLWFF